MVELEEECAEVERLLSLLGQSEGPVLSAGSFSRSGFWVLSELARMRNARVADALEAYLVLGWTRGEACHQYGISVSYFTQRLKVMERAWRLCQFLRTEGVGMLSAKPEERRTDG